MKILKITAIILILAVLGAFTYYTEKKRRAENSVLSGSFENQPTSVSSRTSGRVSEIIAKEGTAVRKGELLLRLDPGPLKTDAEALASQLRESKINLQKLRRGFRPEETARQQAVVKELQANLEKLENGFRPQEIEAARASADKAYINWQKLKSGYRRETVAAAEANLRGAEAALDQAQTEDKRYFSLYRAGAVSQQTYEQRHEAFLTAKAKRDSLYSALSELRSGYRGEEIQEAEKAYRQAREQLSLLESGSRGEDIEIARQRLAQARQELALYEKGYRKEDIQAAEAAVNTKRLQLRAAQERLAEYKVFSPINGTVEKELVSVGDLTEAGQALLKIGNTEDIWLRVYLPQRDLGLIKVGDRAVLHVDSLGSEAVEAYIDSIAAQGEYTPVNLQTPDERAQQVFAVKLRLSKFDPRIKAGMTACVKSMGEWNDSVR